MNTKKRLGELLLEAGVVDETQVQMALAHQRKWGGKLGQALVELKLATEPQIVAALSRKLGYEIVNVATIQWTSGLEEALKLVPSEVALRQTLLPIASDASSVTVAMSDPSNIAVVDELAFRTGRRIKIALAGDRAIAAAVQRFYFGDEERRGVQSRAGVGAADEAAIRAAPPARAAGIPDPGAVRADPIAATARQPVREAGPRPLSGRDAVMLEAVQRAARGEEGALQPGQLANALIRVLLRKGLVSEAELVQELSKP